MVAKHTVLPQIMRADAAMSKITLLHLSDLHWDDAADNDQKIVISALLSDIEQLKKDGISPDIVLFTGDLVQSGDNPISFERARVDFIEPLLHSTNLSLDNFLIVPGNHDISRTAALSPEFIETGLKSTLTSFEKVNSFIDQINSSDCQSISAISRIKAYADFEKSLTTKVPQSDDTLVKTYIYNINGISVGVACFNTAWRATGKPNNYDNRALLLGERNIDIASTALEMADLRIAIFHHPLDWLCEFDETVVTSRLMASFNILMYGHTHAANPQLRVGPSGGALFSQAGCLYQHGNRSYFNGYNVLVIDTDDVKVDIYTRAWFDVPRRAFDAANGVARDGRTTFALPLSPSSVKRPKIESFLRETRQIIRDTAAQHININATAEFSFGAKEAFVCPPLKAESVRSAVAHAEGAVNVDNPSGKSADKQKEENITLERILTSKDNFVIVGDRESGKTSLAHYVSILSSEGCIDTPRIPVIVDYKRSNGLNFYKFRKEFASYFGVTNIGVDIESILKDGDLLIILDNYVDVPGRQREDLFSFMRKYPAVKWILFSDNRENSGQDELEAVDPLRSFQVAQIQALPRRSIRELTSRWCRKTGSNPEKTYSTIISELKTSSLPWTGYIVTLLLWAMYQERHFERINEAVLVQNIVNHLIGSADIGNALLKEFDATSKEITLQQISEHLKESGDFSTKDEVASYLIGFFRRKGLRHNATEVLDILIDSGVLSLRDGIVCFKYRCFQEYFYAQLLRSDHERLNSLFEGFRFVRFARELDFLSGIRRQNADLIGHLLRVLESKRPPEISAFEQGSFSEIAMAESTLPTPRKRIQEIKKKKLTAEQLDDFLDSTERKLSTQKTSYVTMNLEMAEESIKDGDEDAVLRGDNAGFMQPQVFIRTVDLLGRIIRNSEFNDLDEKIRATVVYLDNLERKNSQYTVVFAEIIDNAEESSKGAIALNEEERRIAKYILSKVWVLFTAQAIHEVFSSEKNLELYEEMVCNKENSFYARLMLSFVMMYLFGDGWDVHMKKIVDEACDKRFVLEVIVDLLWYVVNYRYVSDADRTKIGDVLDLVDHYLGRSHYLRGRIIDVVREQAKKTERRLESE